MKRLVFLRQLPLFVIITLFFSSCTKELTPIGLDLLDPRDLLNMGYTDTIQINAYTIPEDSVYTHNLGIGVDPSKTYYAQLGSMYDPIFGRTTANLYSELFLSTKTRFGTNPVFDSAFLYLPYLGSYGDTLSNMTLRVYSLTDSIIDSIHCWSNSTINYDQANPIGGITFQPRPNDSAYYNGARQAKMLRIPINSNFGNYILAADTTSLNDNGAFTRYFKGLAIVSEPQNTPGKGAILLFRISAEQSRLQMYYHNSEDTLNYNFLITAEASKFQNYDHYGYSGAVPALRNQIAGDTTLGKQFLFVQGLAGVKIKIQFPNLANWAEKNNVVINDAQLILGNSSVSETFPYPGSITLRGIGEAGTTSPNPIIDEATRSDYYDGYYYAAGNSYRFRITRYIQNYLLNKVDHRGLHLIIPNSYMGNRLVLNGLGSPQSDLKLYLRYTKIQ